MGVDLPPFKIEKEGIVASFLLGLAGDTVHLTRTAFGNLLDDLSEAYAEEAIRLDSSIANLNRAIAALSDPNR